MAVKCNSPNPKWASHLRQISSYEMPKFLKPGKVALVTRGHYAGRKQSSSKPMTKETKGSHSAALITGRIERYPSKITSRTGKKRIAKRSKIKPFVKLINYNHSMPTRYSLEGIDQLKTQLGNESLNEVWQKDEARKVVKKSFEEKFPTGKNRWFFTPPRF